MELTDAKCDAPTKHAKFLLQTFPQSATDFDFFTDKILFAISTEKDSLF